MNSEMDLLHMDERQRLAWLMANRGTLIAVGLTWIGFIVRELAEGRMPLLLIVMVPVFAALRAGLFYFYCSTPVDLSGTAGAPRRGRLLKVGAAMLLGLVLFLPLYSFADAPNVRLGFSWDLLRDDWTYSFFLALALLWPVATLTLTARAPRRWLGVLTQLLEPLLAALSVLIVLWIPKFEWEARTFWVLFLGFESARPATGTYVAIIGNGLYVVAWLWETLRPWAARSR
jgi:hypothetical protein